MISVREVILYLIKSKFSGPSSNRAFSPNYLRYEITELSARYISGGRR